jgi:hypothetical protein
MGDAEYSADENEIGVGDGVGPHDGVRLARTFHVQRCCDVLQLKSSHQEFMKNSSVIHRFLLQSGTTPCLGPAF